jgi:hypothetical protein
VNGGCGSFDFVALDCLELRKLVVAARIGAQQQLALRGRQQQRPVLLPIQLLRKGNSTVLRLRCATAVAVLAWASALHAADPLPGEPAQAPGAGGPGTVQAFPPIEPLPNAAAPAELAPAPAAPEPPKPSAADRVAMGKNGGFFQPLVLVQIWGVVSHVDDQKTTTTFRLRRAEVGARGEILPKLLTYRVVFDLAKTPAFSSTTAQVPVTAADGGASPGTVAVPSYTLGADRSVLQDAWVGYVSDYADVTVGQFKQPISLQALQPNAKLLFPERSKVTREYGDRRDIGLRVDKKIANVFYYNVALFNGQGQNVTDADRAKDLALRLEAYPIPGLTIGGLAYGTVGAEDVDPVRNRLEADLRLELADLIVQGEYIHGWTGPKARKLEGHGAYGEAGYLIAKQFQPVVRVGFLDTNIGGLKPNSIPESGVQQQFELGLNYLVDGFYDGKLTAAFAYYSQEHGPDTSELTLQAQATF